MSDTFTATASCSIEPPNHHVLVHPVPIVNVGAATLVVVSEPSPGHTVMGLALSHAASHAVGCALLGTLLARRDILQPGAMDHQLRGS